MIFSSLFLESVVCFRRIVNTDCDDSFFDTSSG
jgi:hypothetical protein